MQIINYFKALADETRVRLLHLLLFHELNVNEIVSILNIGQPRVSRHLKILLDYGLVSFRRDGLWVFYSAIVEGSGSNFIESIKSLLCNEIEIQSDIIKCKEILELRTRETTRFFDSIAGDWSKLKTNIIGKLDLNDTIVKYIRRCNLAADIGCGTGDLIPVMLNKVENVIGVDRSQKMLEEAKRFLSTNEDRLSLRLGEIEHLPIGNNEVDCAILNMVLHHLSTPKIAIDETWRVIKKGGSLIIVDFLKHTDETMRTKYGDRWLGFSGIEITGWLKEANFSISKKKKFKIKNGLSIALYLSIKQ